MPEGDTIFLAARRLRAALAGHVVQGVRVDVGRVQALGPQRLVGQAIGDVESRGKHVLCWFAPSGLALHTHLGMHGAWHVYRPDEPWRKPAHRARVVIEVQHAVAVCFAASQVELLTRAQVDTHARLARLGPDALARDVDLAEARRRLDEAPARCIADALLDQRVLAGVGNVYKSELLFLHAVHPCSPVGAVPARVRDALLATAVELLRRNVHPAARPGRTTTGARAERLYVYGRARLPCLRCGTPIAVGRTGQHRRVTYWCPRCQPPAS